MRILIVDDDMRACEVLADILTSSGEFEVAKASTGREALLAARKEDFDVALVDIQLPDINGVDLLKSLKAINSFLEGIIVTGHASLENAIRAMSEGAFGYLVKPFNMDELMATIKKAIEKKQASKDLKNKLIELEEFKNLTTGREEHEADLKQQVNALSKELGQGPRYKI